MTQHHIIGSEADAPRPHVHVRMGRPRGGRVSWRVIRWHIIAGAAGALCVPLEAWLNIPIAGPGILLFLVLMLWGKPLARLFFGSR